MGGVGAGFCAFETTAEASTKARMARKTERRVMRKHIPHAAELLPNHRSSPQGKHTMWLSLQGQMF